MRTPKDEREVLAGGYVYETDGTKAERMTVYVSDYGYMLKFDRYCKENPEERETEREEVVDGDVVSKTYSFPVSCLSFRKKTRKLTPEERERMAAIGKANFAKFHR